MYSRCQTLSLLFTTQLQKISRALHLDAEDNIPVIDLGRSNINNIGGIDIRRLPARDPFTGAVLLWRPEITPAPTTQAPLFSSTLESFIRARRQAEAKNSDLSDKFNLEASDYELKCPILYDFPLIPVLFNGRLYDFDSLMTLAKSGVIIDPYSNEKISLAPHVIQPHFAAQKQMDDLLSVMKNKNLPAIRPQ